MSIADIAVWIVVALIVIALIYVHRPKVAAPAASTSALTGTNSIGSTVGWELEAGEKAVEAYIAKFEADAKAWADRTAQVQAVKEKVAAVAVPAVTVPAAPVAH